MKKVFILADGGHDYSDAKRFGDLIFLNIPSEAKWDIARLYSEMKEGLMKAEHDDYLIISHLTSHCCVATAIMVEWFGRVNFLIYRGNVYEEKILVLNNEVINDTND